MRFEIRIVGGSSAIGEEFRFILRTSNELLLDVPQYMQFGICGEHSSDRRGVYPGAVART